MNAPLPSPPPLRLQTPPPTPLAPLFPSFHLRHAAFLHALHSRPLLTPGFAALCYDCGRGVLHTYLLAPILCRDAHIKDCHFQRSGVSHAHKCCPDTWSGKIKTACLPVRVLCLRWVGLQRQVSQMSFPFSPSPPLFFPSVASVLGGIHSLCKLAAEEEVMVCSLVCRAVGNARGKCDTVDFNKHD